MRFASSLLFAASLWALTLVAAGVTADPATLSIDEIKPGMKGYGLTVFRGTKPERFDVEVIDVLRDFRPDLSLILIRTPHPVLNHTNVVAGMSGSPIYLEGKLAGAYSYGWMFGKDPVAGVTPIANMRGVLRRRERASSFPGASPVASGGMGASHAAGPRGDLARFAGLPAWDGAAPRGAFAAAREYAAAHPRGPAVRGLEQASTPVMLSGFTDEVAALVANELAPLGLVGLQGGGGQGKAKPNAAFENGGAIAVQLVRGDVNMVGVGTVTEVLGPRLTAFGHPMLNGGEVGLPTATARVLHILASQSRSFKIAEAETPLGTLVQDRLPAIVADTKLKPAVIPIHVTVRGVDPAARTEWRMEAASHRILSPMIVYSAIANAIGATASDVADVMFTATSRTDVEGIGPIELTDRGHVRGGFGDGTALGALRVFDLMEAAFANPFGPARIKSVDVVIDLRFERDVIEIVDGSVGALEVDPGSDVPVDVVLRRYGRGEESMRLMVHVPTQAAGEEIEIRIEPGDKVQLAQPVAESLSDLVYSVKNRLGATSLVTSMRLPSQGLRFRGHVVDNLPGSAFQTLQPQNTTWRGISFATYDRRVTEMGSVVHGWVALKLRVRETPLHQ